MGVVGPELGASSECEPVIRALPEWFQDENSVRGYIDAIDELPTFKVHDDGNLVGFLSIKQHYDDAAEILIFAVRREYQGDGVGSRLLDAAETWLAARGCSYLQLKTLAASADDSNYEATRAFYVRRGFVALEEFPTLWHESFPCLLMVKKLDNAP